MFLSSPNKIFYPLFTTFKRDKVATYVLLLALVDQQYDVDVTIRVDRIRSRKLSCDVTESFILFLALKYQRISGVIGLLNRWYGLLVLIYGDAIGS